MPNGERMAPIAIRVNREAREERRLSLQNQPTRTTVPLEREELTSAPPATRKSVVQNMIAQRAMKRGRIMV